MLERFTVAARIAVLEAQDERRRAGATHVLPGHLLAALLADPTGPRDGASRGIAADALHRAGVRRDDARLVLARASAAVDDVVALDPDVLAGVGIDLDAIRRHAEQAFGPGALDAPSARPASRGPFAPSSKKALELALREAVALRARSISDGHLLLGILRVEDPSATAVLRYAGADIDALRRDVRARLAAEAA